jgi:hypothetical protein
MDARSVSVTVARHRSYPRPAADVGDAAMREAAVAMARPSYTIRGGQADADRLARQAALMAPATSAFLTRAGLRPGWACLDVGCGDGRVTLQLARALGPPKRSTCWVKKVKRVGQASATSPITGCGCCSTVASRWRTHRTARLRSRSPRFMA